MTGFRRKVAREPDGSFLARVRSRESLQIERLADCALASGDERYADLLALARRPLTLDAEEDDDVARGHPLGRALALVAA